ncbi:uncharacterized protein [Oscarella lobularis]|uniref:uncharacterized protein n=1 Tax=Oscarella lobularis TaxID=121494 RepID=UPI0033143C9F
MNKSKSGVREKAPPAAVPCPPPVREVVPGRFTENDWTELLENESNADVVAEILDDLVFSAWDLVYSREIERLVYPYTVEWAREIVEQIVEWQFLERDEGELNTEVDVNWQEDEEPEAPETDSWARGVVPKTIRRKAVAREEKIKEEKEEERFDLISRGCGVDLEKDCVEELVNDFDGMDRGSVLKKIASKNAKKLKKTIRKKVDDDVEKKTTKDYHGSETATQMTVLEQRANQPLHASRSILRVQMGRPPGPKQVVYDSRGNVLNAVKLNPSRFPSHRISTKFSVLNPIPDRRTSVPQQFSKQSLSESNPSQSSSLARVSNQSVHKTLIDSIDAAPGVIIREGDKVKAGSVGRNSPGEGIVSAERRLYPLGQAKEDGNHGSGTLHAGSPVVRLLDRPVRAPVVYKEA